MARAHEQHPGSRSFGDLMMAESGATGGPEREFSIRDLTKEFGVTARTLRFYEEKGLLQPRRQGLERIYSRRDRARLTYVLMGRNVGFSLDDVREMLDLYDVGDDQVTQLTVAQDKFRAQIARLEQQRRDIDRAITELKRASHTVTKMLSSRTRGARATKT
jgi:DNA-binding transcriptional MerR regulator